MVLRLIFRKDGFVVQGFVILDQVFVVFFMLVGQYLVFDMDVIDDVVVGCWLVCVFMDEGGVVVGVEEIVGGGCLQVGIRIFFVVLVGFVDFVYVGGDGVMFSQGFGEQGGLLFWIVYLGLECYIGCVVQIEGVVV